MIIKMIPMIEIVKFHQTVSQTEVMSLFLAASMIPPTSAYLTYPRKEESPFPSLMHRTSSERERGIDIRRPHHPKES